MRLISSMTNVVVILLLAVGLTMSRSGSLRADLSVNQDSYRMLNLLGEAFERVRSHYVESLEDEVLVEAAIRGMMAALDPYSDYLDAKHLEEMRTRSVGEFGGLGIEVTLDETGYIRVISPIDGTPAARVGIQPDDLITHVDGTEVINLTLDEALSRMRGKINTRITLKILRGNTVIEPTLIRESIQIRSVRQRVLKDQIGYIRITNFNGHTSSAVEKTIRKLDENNTISGFIIDLRNNPGGLLDEAVQISDGFLNHGEIVSIRGRENQSIQRFQAHNSEWTSGRPIVVLINRGSASAAEILAGALQDHQRATLVGMPSFGKGSVQTIIPLKSNNAALKLTTQYYYTPSGRSIAEVGLTPDIEIAALPPVKQKDGKFLPPSKDVQLERATEILLQQLS